MANRVIAKAESAYEIAVRNGFVGTEEEWLDSLRGADGADATPPAAVIHLAFDGGPDPVEVGSVASVVVPFNATITGWQVFSARETGSVSIAVDKTTYADYPTTTTVSDTDPITLNVDTKAQSPHVDNWNTAITANDILILTVESVTDATLVEVIVFMQREL